MSSRSLRRAGLGAALLALFWPGYASAQLSDADLVRQLDSLRPLVTEALAAAQEASDRRLREQAESRRTAIDTVRIGALRVLALPAQADLVEELFEEVWEETFAMVGESPALERWLLTFQWRARLERMDFGPDRGAGAPPIRQLGVNRIWQPSREGAKARIRSGVAAVLTEDFADESPMRGWMTARGYPASADVYRSLAGTASGANRACLVGDARACWTALGLGLADAGPRLTEWLAPETLAGIVVEASERPGSGIDRDDPTVRACTEESNGIACVRLITQGVEWARGVPISANAFAHMFWHAVRTGGAGAWQRVLERSDATPPELLTYVSGLSPEQLAASWRETVVASRPDVNAGLDTTRWAALFWFLFFAAFAMRSTRWRLG
jgi:hypothetical protein